MYVVSTSSFLEFVTGELETIQLLNVAVKQYDSFDASYFSIENVVVGVDKLLPVVNSFRIEWNLRFDSLLYLLAWLLFRKGKAMRQNYIVINEKKICTSIAISSSGPTPLYHAVHLSPCVQLFSCTAIIFLYARANRTA